MLIPGSSAQRPGILGVAGSGIVTQGNDNQLSGFELVADGSANAVGVEVALGQTTFDNVIVGQGGNGVSGGLTTGIQVDGGATATINGSTILSDQSTANASSNIALIAQTGSVVIADGITATGSGATAAAALNSAIGSFAGANMTVSNSILTAVGTGAFTADTVRALNTSVTTLINNQIIATGVTGVTGVTRGIQVSAGATVNLQNTNAINVTATGGTILGVNISAGGIYNMTGGNTITTNGVANAVAGTVTTTDNSNTCTPPGGSC